MPSVSILKPTAQHPTLSIIPQTQVQNDSDSIPTTISSLRDNIRAAQESALSLIYCRPIRSYLRLAKIVQERFKGRGKDRDVLKVTTSTADLSQRSDWMN